MNIKLADLLFEEDENKEEVEEEVEVEGIPIEGNVQSLSKSTIEQVSKYVASAINRKMPNKENVPKSAEDNPLGVIQFKDLKLLSNVPIKGLYVSPSQIKGEQQAGLSQTDFKKYEQQQIVPLFLRNDESENIGSNSKGQEMAAIFYLPAMFCDIEDEANKKIHAQLFDLPSIGKDKVYYHTEIKSLKYELVMKDDIENIQNSFKTGNGKILSKVSMKAKRNIPSGANEKKGESETAQANNESYFSNKTIIIKDKNKRATYNMQKLHKNKLSQLLFESDLNELHSQDLKENFVYRSGISRLLNEEMITGDEFYVNETFEGAVKRVEDLLDNDTIIKFQNKEHDFNVYAKKMFDDNLLLLITKNGNLIKATSDFLTFSRDKNSFFQAIYKIVNDNIRELNLDPRARTTDLAKSLITNVFYDGKVPENVDKEFQDLISNNKGDDVISKVINHANRRKQSGKTLEFVSSFIEKYNLEDKQKVNLKTNLNTLNLVSDEKFINFAEQVVSFDKENPGEAFKTITYMSPQSAKALNSLLTSEESVADTLVSSYKDLPREISDTLTPEELQKSFNELDDDKKKKIEQSLIKTPEERQTTSSDEDKDTAEEIVEFRLKGNGDNAFYSIDNLNANGKFRFVMWQRQRKGWEISTDLDYNTLEEAVKESEEVNVFFDLAGDKEKEFIKKNFAKVLDESSKGDDVNFNIIRDFTGWSLKSDIEAAEQTLTYQSKPSEERQTTSSDEDQDTTEAGEETPQAEEEQVEDNTEQTGQNSGETTQDSDSDAAESQEENQPQGEENQDQPQDEQETDLISKDKWLDTIDIKLLRNGIDNNSYHAYKTDGRDIPLVKIKGKLYYLKNWDFRSISIPDLENITSLNKDKVIKEKLEKFFKKNLIHEIETGEHIFKSSNISKETLYDYISNSDFFNKISKSLIFVEKNTKTDEFVKLMNLAVSLDDKKDFDENVDKTYPNLKKYFGDFKDTKGFDGVVKSIKDLYETDREFTYDDLINGREDSIDNKIDKRVIKDFERKVLNFISKNEKLIFNKFKKTGSEDSLHPQSKDIYPESFDEIKDKNDLFFQFIDKLSQLMLHNFIKKQSMFENKFIFQTGINLLLEAENTETEEDRELRNSLVSSIKDQSNRLAKSLILGLVNHAVNNDMIDYSWKPESDRAGKIMSSKVLAKRIKKVNNLSDSNEISEDMIRSMLLEDLKNICLGVVEKYDPERYEIMLNKADSIILKDERGKERGKSKLSKKAKSRIATAGIVAATGAVAALTGGASLIPSLFGSGTLAAIGTAATKAGVSGVVTSGLGIAGAQTYKGDKIFDYFKNKIVGEKSDQELADRLVEREGAEHVITQREDGIYKLLKSEIDELIQLILVLVKEDKGIVEENKNLFIGSLSKFLFEANESGEEISVQDIKDYLKASGILIYNKDSKVIGKDLSVAEKELIGSIAAIFKSHFGVNVKGSEGYKKLDTKRVEVASTVNQNAEKGEAASEQISNMTAGAGIPMGMNAPFNMNQMAAMINMMGGNPMMSFMMMMMNPQFMQQMMQMQKEGVTLGEASKVVAEKTEISDFDKLLEDVIENQRTSLPSISRKDAIKVVKLLKNIYGAFNDIGTDMSGVTFNPDKKKSILFKMHNSFNIVKEDQDITDNTLKILHYFIKQELHDAKLKGEILKILTGKHKILEIFIEDTKNTTIDMIGIEIIDYVNSKFLSTLFNDFRDDYQLKDSVYENVFKIIKVMSTDISEKITDDYKKSVDACLDEVQEYIDSKINLSDVSKITAENKLIRNKSIIRRRPIRKNKIINESEFLKSELKRLWKL